MARIKAVGGRHETWIAEELQTSTRKNQPYICTWRRCKAVLRKLFRLVRPNGEFCKMPDVAGADFRLISRIGICSNSGIPIFPNSQGMQNHNCSRRIAGEAARNFPLQFRLPVGQRLTPLRGKALRAPGVSERRAWTK